MKAALEALDLPMVILTNASKSWAKRALAQIELSHMFEDTRIISLEDVDFKAKAHHADGFVRGLELLGTRPENTLVVEDLARNLPLAKELGLTTALVHHGQIPDVAPAHVDMYFQTTLELVQLLSKS